MDQEIVDLEDPSSLEPKEIPSDAEEVEDAEEEEIQAEPEVDMTELYDEGEEEEGEVPESTEYVTTFPPEEDEGESQGEEQIMTEEEFPMKYASVEWEAEAEEEIEGEEGEDFPVLPSGQGDFMQEIEEAEDEEYPKELPEPTPVTDDILTQAEVPSTESAETVVPVPQQIVSRPKIFICGEEENERNIQMESYCCQQIKIPPMLPHILKTFTKGAIKTQPRDLLRWSAAYFRALANDEPPPVKERLEYPTLESLCGLTKGLLRVLHKQLGKNEQVRENVLRDKWMGLCLDGSELTKLLHLNSLDSIFDWTKFIVVASASIVNEHIVETMTVFCETMTLQPDGVDPYVPYQLFVEAYTFLAEKMGVDMNQAEQVCSFLRDLSTANFYLIGPKDYMAQECPPLF